jgi:hypothetical protein
MSGKSIFMMLILIGFYGSALIYLVNKAFNKKAGNKNQ